MVGKILGEAGSSHYVVYYVVLKVCSAVFKKNKCIDYLNEVVNILLVAQGVESNPGPIEMADLKILLEEITAKNAEAVRQAKEEQMLHVQGEFDGFKSTVEIIEAACQAKYDEVKVDVATLEAENKRLAGLIEANDLEKRKNNIVIFQIPESESERNISTFALVHEICGSMDVHLGQDSIVETFRLGRIKNKRPILVKLTSFEAKKQILYKNKNSREPLAIMHDLTQKEREFRNEMKPYAEAERQKGNKVFIRGSKIFINGVECNNSQLIQSHDNITAVSAQPNGRQGEKNITRSGPSHQRVAIQNKPPVPPKPKEVVGRLQVPNITDGPSTSGLRSYAAKTSTAPQQREATVAATSEPLNEGMDWQQVTGVRRRSAVESSTAETSTRGEKLQQSMQGKYSNITQKKNIEAVKRQKLARA
jgi:hypothetical protein